MKVQSLPAATCHLEDGALCRLESYYISPAEGHRAIPNVTQHLRETDAC